MKITLSQAQTVANAAIENAGRIGIAVTVSVVDDAGRLVLTLRGDGTGFATPETSRAKAFATAAFKKKTNLLAGLREQNPFWQEISTVMAGQVLPTAGGSPILIKGEIAGGVGIGGGTPEQDQLIADKAAEAVS